MELEIVRMDPPEMRRSRKPYLLTMQQTDMVVKTLRDNPGVWYKVYSNCTHNIAHARVKQLRAMGFEATMRIMENDYSSVFARSK